MRKIGELDPYDLHRVVHQEMRDDAEVTGHQILGLGHDSLARRRHSAQLLTPSRQLRQPCQWHDHQDLQIMLKTFRCGLLAEGILFPPQKQGIEAGDISRDKIFSSWTKQLLPPKTSLEELLSKKRYWNSKD